MLGTFILWFGWIGFNVGPVIFQWGPEIRHMAGLIMVNTTVSGGAAGITGLFFNLFLVERRTGEPILDLMYAMNGSLAGLVAITAGAGVIEPWAALVTGSLAGVLYVIGSHFLIHLRIDDAVDAIPVHLFNGVWGLISVGLFAVPSKLEIHYERSDHPGWFYSLREGESDGRLMGLQLIGLLFIFGWVSCIMLPFFIFLNYLGWLRADPLDEIVGLDLSYHEGLALVKKMDIRNTSNNDVDETILQQYKERREGKVALRSSDSRHNAIFGLKSNESLDENGGD